MGYKHEGQPTAIWELNLFEHAVLLSLYYAVSATYFKYESPFALNIANQRNMRIQVFSYWIRKMGCLFVCLTWGDGWPKGLTHEGQSAAKWELNLFKHAVLFFLYYAIAAAYFKHESPFAMQITNQRNIVIQVSSYWIIKKLLFVSWPWAQASKT